MLYNKTLGFLGEQKALEFLLSQGYLLLHRNWKQGRGGEIDLVMQQKNHLIFVEVKTRARTIFLPAEMAVSQTQQKKLIQMAQAYMHTFAHLHFEARFDVLGVTFLSEKEAHITHVPEAFYALR